MTSKVPYGTWCLLTPGWVKVVNEVTVLSDGVSGIRANEARHHEPSLTPTD